MLIAGSINTIATKYQVACPLVCSTLYVAMEPAKQLKATEVFAGHTGLDCYGP